MSKRAKIRLSGLKTIKLKNIFGKKNTAMKLQKNKSKKKKFQKNGKNITKAMW